jgi:hypothetical protein
MANSRLRIDQQLNNGERQGDAHEPPGAAANVGDFDPADLEAGESLAAPNDDPAPNPFINLDDIREDAEGDLGFNKPLTVLAQKPNKTWWFRVNPDPAYQLNAYLLELKADRDTVFLVAKPLGRALANDTEGNKETTLSLRKLVTAINTQGIVFLWPLRLPDPSGRDDKWGARALEAAYQATKQWTRLQPDMTAGTYQITQATAPILEPVWPEKSLSELLNLAFKGDKYITSVDHPILKKLLKGG